MNVFIALKGTHFFIFNWLKHDGLLSVQVKWPSLRVHGYGVVVGLLSILHETIVPPAVLDEHPNLNRWRPKAGCASLGTD